MEREIVLSVVIPVYNGSKYLDRMIKMLDHQTFRRFEVIFVDDGSLDDTYKRCKEYGKNRPYIHVIRQHNQGVSHARNTGIQVARGKWIQFIDIDDVIREDMFACFSKKLVERADTDVKSENTEAELAVCGCVRRMAGSSVLCGPKKNVYLLRKGIIELFREMKMENRYWILDYTWNKWYRKDIIEHFNIRFLENLSLGEDFVFNTQYIRHINSLVLIPEYCYEYEVHEDGLASRFQERPWEVRKILYDNQRGLYQTFEIWDAAIPEIRRPYGQIYWGDIRQRNSRGCRLNGRQRLKFIRRMAADEMFDMIPDYLSTKKGAAYKIYRAVFKTHNVYLIYTIIRLEKLKSLFLCSGRV